MQYLLAVTLLAAVLGTSCAGEVPPVYQALARLTREERAFAISSLFDDTVRSSYDDAIIQMLEDLRQNMTAPMDSLGLPQLEPLSIAHLELDIHESFGDLVLIADQATVQHISTYVIDNIHLNVLGLTLDFGFSLPLLAANGLYSADGMLAGLLPLYGSGPFNIGLSGLALSGKVTLGSNNTFLYIKNFELHYNITGINADIQGLLGGGDLSALLNEVFHDVGPQILNQLEPEVSAMISAKITEIANVLLDGMTINDLLGMLGGRSYQFFHPLLKEAARALYLI